MQVWLQCVPPPHPDPSSKTRVLSETRLRSPTPLLQTSDRLMARACAESVQVPTQPWPESGIIDGASLQSSLVRRCHFQLQDSKERWGPRTGTRPFHRYHRVECRRDVTSLFTLSPSSPIGSMMFVSRDACQFFGTAETPSPTFHLDPGAYRPALTLNHRPTLLALMIPSWYGDWAFRVSLLPWAH